MVENTLIGNPTLEFVAAQIRHTISEISMAAQPTNQIYLATKEVIYPIRS
jgi:hypothetical protein